MLNLSSKDNVHIKNAVKLQKSAKLRRKKGLFAAEGIRICFDAMLSGAHIDTLFVTEAAIEKNFAKIEALKSYADKAFCISSELFSFISDTQTPQGCLGIIKTLDKTTNFDTIKNGGKFLALENVQDPNNLGTVLRSAEAFGISGVILSADCCDIYNPKVVRGSMGAIFRIPIMICSGIADFINQNPTLSSFAAVVDRQAKSITEVRFTEPCVAVIGNEGNGLKEETVSACKEKMTIPMKGKAESLNASAAASVIIWEMVK